MTDVADFNVPLFARATGYLRARGLTVLSPHEILNTEDWQRAMRADLTALLACGAIVLLPGWPHSRGARLELMYRAGPGSAGLLSGSGSLPARQHERGVNHWRAAGLLVLDYWRRLVAAGLLAPVLLAVVLLAPNGWRPIDWRRTCAIGSWWSSADSPGCRYRRPMYRFCRDRKWRFDYAWPDRLLALEIEGGAFIGGRHTRAGGFIGDLHKYNRAACDGWRVLRVIPQHIDNGVALAWLRVALGGRG